MSSIKNSGPNALSSLDSVSPGLNAIQYEAIEWHAKMSGATDAKIEQAFDDWMAISEVHRQAYLEAELLDEGLGELSAQSQIVEELISDRGVDDFSANPASDRLTIINKSNVGKSSLGKWGAFAMAACLAVATAINLGWFANQAEPNQLSISKTFASQYQSGTGELKEIALPDGSQVTLGPNSLLNVSFNESHRKVELVLGEAYFDVSKAATWPFFVEADQASVRVVGTRFDVRSLVEATSVSVIEGVVQVFNGKDSARLRARELLPTTLMSGQYAKSDGKTDIVVQEVQGDKNLVAWLDGRLVYQGAELRDVIADANRYSKSGSIRLNDLSLGKEKVTLSVNVNSLDDLPLMLAELMSLDMQQSSEETVLSIKQ